MDDPLFHTWIRNSFCALVDADPMLKAHRDWVEAHHWGFGERCLHWMWKLLVDDVMNHWAGKPCRFIEVGVYCGQVISLVDMLSFRSRLDSHSVGVSTYDGTGSVDYPHYPKVDYMESVRLIFNEFNMRRYPVMIRGDSRDQKSIIDANRFGPYSLLYIDGGHEAATVESDLRNYTPMLEVGGYLVIDDSCTKLNLPIGCFAGWSTVSDAVDVLLPPLGTDPFGENWKHVGCVSHNRCWRKLK